MKIITAIFTLAVLGTIVAITAAVVKARLASGVKDTSRFKAKTFLPPNELEFFHRLEASVPELRFHAQVAMGSVLDPAVSKKQSPKAYISARGRFSRKIIDFVAQRRDNGTIVAIIELDDRTHSAEKDAERDAMLEQAGYKVIRWASKSKPEAASIREALLPAPATQIQPAAETRARPQYG
jgi:hypothetical protein